MAHIKIENIKKSFNENKVLKNIDLEIKSGELISILGPSGCGKSTTLKIIGGLIKADEGEIYIDKKNIKDEKTNAIIVFQDYLLFPHMTVENNISFGLKMAKKNKSYIKSKVKNLISLLQLEGHEKKYPSQLSGGQKQRVAIGRALAVEPKVLLLDEPFSNLDINLRESMRQFVLDLQRKLKITTILVTHDKEEALLYSDKVAIMIDGEIKDYNTSKEIYENPKDIEVCRFFGDRNYIEGSIEDRQFISDLIKVRTKIKNKERATCVIRPETIILNKGNINEYDGIIEEIKYAGDKIYYMVKINNISLRVCKTNYEESFTIKDYVKIKFLEKHLSIY